VADGHTESAIGHGASGILQRSAVVDRIAERATRENRICFEIEVSATQFGKPGRIGRKSADYIR
jgi:hypothetical protein